MSVAYLVLAHSRPQQLMRLVDRLQVPGTDVFVHVDRRAPDAVVSALVRHLGRREGVHLLPRVRSAWSGWGLVEATLRGIEIALRTRPQASHVIVVSGQDYLLRAPEAIVDFFERAPGLTFMNWWTMPWSLYGPDGGMRRLRYWHVPFHGWRLRAPLPRRLPDGLRPHGGSQFFALDATTAGWLLEFARTQPDVERFYRHVWAPEEHYVHTALCNSPRREHVLDEGLWHIDWAGAHPKVLGVDDLPALVRSARCGSDTGGPSRAKLFARKFDAELDSDVLDGIDAELLRPRNAQRATSAGAAPVPPER